MATLFIAEDDPLMGRMYERAFKLSGHQVLLAGDGESALEMLRGADTKPAVVLLDVMMPKMSGFDVLRKMKEDAQLKQIPVVLLTNLAGHQDAERGLQLGAELYLVKSDFSPKQVVEKIESLIKIHETKAPETPSSPSPIPPIV